MKVPVIEIVPNSNTKDSNMVSHVLQTSQNDVVQSGLNRSDD